MLPAIIVQIRDAEDLKEHPDRHLRPAIFLSLTSLTLYSVFPTPSQETNIKNTIRPGSGLGTNRMSEGSSKTTPQRWVKKQVRDKISH